MCVWFFFLTWNALHFFSNLWIGTNSGLRSGKGNPVLCVGHLLFVGCRSNLQRVLFTGVSGVVPDSIWLSAPSQFVSGVGVGLGGMQLKVWSRLSQRVMAESEARATEVTPPVERGRTGSTLASLWLPLYCKFERLPEVVATLSDALPEEQHEGVEVLKWGKKREILRFGLAVSNLGSAHFAWPLWR